LRNISRVFSRPSCLKLTIDSPPKPMDEYPLAGVNCQGFEVPVAPVKWPAALILTVLSSLFLAGCWNGRVLLAFERPFWTSLDGGPRVALALGLSSAGQGYFPRLIVSGQAEHPSERLAAEAAAGRYSAVVVGPLLSFDWRTYAPQNARTRFILLGGISVTDLPPNTVSLRFDRRNAFRAAGAAAGMAVKDGAAAGPGAGAAGARIAVLLSPSPVLEPIEVDAFSEGVARVLDGSRPLVRMVTERVDKPTVKTVIEEMHKEGVEIFLLGMGALDAWALEVLKGTGGSAVVGDWSSSGAFPRQVFLSVEEDLAGGIGRALGSRREAREVMGPVRLVGGRARPVSREMLFLVEGK
jgi:hypothetical protein